MKYLPLFLLFATGANAHVGHIGTLAGHDHWVAGAAIGLAAAVTIWGALKGSRKSDSDEVAEDGDNAELEETA